MHRAGETRLRACAPAPLPLAPDDAAAAGDVRPRPSSGLCLYMCRGCDVG